MGLFSGWTRHAMLLAISMGLPGIRPNCHTFGGERLPENEKQTKAALDEWKLATKKGRVRIAAHDAMTVPMRIPNDLSDHPEVKTPADSVRVHMDRLYDLTVGVSLENGCVVIFLLCDCRDRVGAHTLKDGEQDERDAKPRSCAPYPPKTIISPHGVMLPGGAREWPDEEALRTLNLTEKARARKPLKPGYFGGQCMFTSRATRRSYWNTFLEYVEWRLGHSPLPEGTVLVLNWSDGNRYIFEHDPTRWRVERTHCPYSEADQTIFAEPLRYATERLGLEPSQIAIMMHTVDSDAGATHPIVTPRHFPHLPADKVLNDIEIMWVRWSNAATCLRTYSLMLRKVFGPKELMILCLAILGLDFVRDKDLRPRGCGTAKAFTLLQRILDPMLPFRDDIMRTMREVGGREALEQLLALLYAHYYAFDNIASTITMEEIREEMSDAEWAAPEVLEAAKLSTLTFALYWLLKKDGFIGEEEDTSSPA